MDSVTIQEAVVATEPIPNYRPDAKTRRYDRQLRLWASSGQQSLESSKVLLIGADATGCQTLKNLVLPGIGHFTILSSEKVTSSEIGTNFFLVPESFSLDVASEATRLLCELNPGVEGGFRVADHKELIKTEPEWFLGFTMIVAVNLEPDFELELSDLLWKDVADIPLITVRNSGFIGKVRTQFKEHCVVDTHPDNLHTLRIDEPFPALKSYAKEMDLDKMDSMEHSHVPYVVLLIRALDEWKISHDGNLPEWNDQEAFKEILFNSRRALDEENFEEAESQLYRVSDKSKVPSTVEDLLKNDKCQNVTKDSKNFWLLLKALQEFILLPSSSGLPPLSASLPDMKASTTSYVELQNLYKTKAREDVETFKGCLKNVLSSVGLEESLIGDEEVESFVKNIIGLGVFWGKSLREGVDGDEPKNTLVDGGLADEEDTALAYYAAFLGSELFFKANGRWPGTNNKDYSELEADTEAVITEVEKKLKSWGYMESLEDHVRDAVAEVCRGGASTIPTTAALLGGIVSQEAIKLITCQYQPLVGTAIIDLIKGGINKWSDF